MREVREGLSEADCEQEAEARAEPGGDRLRPEAVAERHRHEHHRERADHRHAEGRVPVQDRRDQELDHDQQARHEPDQRPQAVQPARGEEEHREADRQPQHRPTPVVVGERVGRQPRHRRGSARRRGRRLEDADPVACREAAEAGRARDQQRRRCPAVGSLGQFRAHRAAPGYPRDRAGRAGDRDDLCSECLLRRDRARARDLAVRPEEDEPDDRRADRDRRGEHHQGDDRRSTRAQPREADSLRGRSRTSVSAR